MIIHRLTIKNYRGVEEASVKFSPMGITLIEGDNEVGKTSLVQALHNIFEYTDNSKHRNITAIKPTHRDEGPEIELEAEVGPYHFTYFKRFHRTPATCLTFFKPSTEMPLTAREAHERAERILRENVDWDLWKAVGVQQGEGITQADLKVNGSLAAALDRAAGSEADGEEDSLLELLEKEYLKYFTPTGKKGKDLEKAKEEEKSLEDQLAELKRLESEVEKDAIRAGVIKEDIRKRERSLGDLKTENKRVNEDLDKVSTLENEIEKHEIELKKLERDCEAAEYAFEVRKKLIWRIEDQEKEIEELTGLAGSEAEKLKEAEDKVSVVGKSLDAFAKKKREFGVIMDLRQKDFEFYRDCHDLELMKERKERVDEARAKAKGAGSVLEKIRIGEDELEEILVAEGEVRTARAGLQMDAPSLAIKSLKDVDLELDGKKLVLKSGKERLESVTEVTNILVPDILEIKVAPGTSSKGLRHQLEVAEEKLSRLLQKHGVSDRTDAKKQIQTRENAASQIEAVKKTEQENLRDLTYEGFAEKIKGLEDVTANYIKERGETPPMVGNLDSSRKIQQEAEEALKEVEQDRGNADSVHRAAEANRNRLSAQVSNVEGQLLYAKKDLTDVIRQLEEDRKSTNDSELERALASAREAMSRKSGVIGLKSEDLSRLNPEQIRALAGTSAESLKTAEVRLRGLMDEEIELKARLDVKSEEGLHEKILKVEGDFFRKQRDNRILSRRAAAATLLYTTMKEEQGKAHEKYKAPFKDKIEQLGRLVYNDTFQVVLKDGLNIKDRSLDGRTVPFDSLSGGAKEQLSILARIAAAMLVSDDKPVPIIIDDALGYTDPGRLKMMGAVLAQAGMTGQVIVLTCTPERYAHLGKVEIVPMRSTPAAEKHE